MLGLAVGYFFSLIVFFTRTYCTHIAFLHVLRFSFSGISSILMVFQTIISRTFPLRMPFEHGASPFCEVQTQRTHEGTARTRMERC